MKKEHTDRDPHREFDEKSKPTFSDYDPDETSVAILKDIYQKMNACDIMSLMSLREFNNRTKVQYDNDNMLAAASYLPSNKEANKADWQTVVSLPDTENQLYGLVSFVAARRELIELLAVNKNEKVDNRMSGILDSLIKVEQEKDNMLIKKFEIAFNQASLGTVVVHSAYVHEEKENKVITKVKKDMTVEYTKENVVQYDGMRSSIISPINLFIPNYYESDLEKQPFIIIREVLSYQTFKIRYGKYPNAQFVRPKNQFINVNSTQANYFYNQYWLYRFNDFIDESAQIEVLHFYSKQYCVVKSDGEYKELGDIHHILVNGVLLTQEDNPMESVDGNYPLTAFKAQPMANTNFFWGRSIADKMERYRYLRNLLMEQFMDRTTLSTQVKYVANSESDVVFDQWGPAQVLQLRPDDQLREFKVDPVNSSEFSIFTEFGRIIQEVGLSPQEMGQVSNATATAIMQATQAALRNVSVFLMYHSNGFVNMMYSWCASILWYLSKPNAYSTKSREVIDNDAMLSDGTRGLRIIRIVKNQKSIPSENSIQDETESIRQSGIPNVEIVYVTARKLANIRAKIKAVPYSSIPENQALEKTLILEFISTISKLFPQKFPAIQDDLFEKVSEKYGFNFNREMVAQMQEIMQSQAQAGMPGNESNPSIMPNVSSQVVEGATQVPGKEQASIAQSLSKLVK